MRQIWGGDVVCRLCGGQSEKPDIQRDDLHEGSLLFQSFHKRVNSFTKHHLIHKTLKNKIWVFEFNLYRKIATLSYDRILGCERRHYSNF